MNFDRQVEVQAGDRKLLLGPLTVEILLQFRDWIATQIGDPFAVLSRPYFDKLSPAEQLKRVEAAEDTDEQLRMFSGQCPLAKRWLTTEAGIRHYHLLLLQANHPNATPADAWAAANEIGRRIQAELEEEANAQLKALVEQVEPLGNGAAPGAIAKQPGA